MKKRYKLLFSIASLMFAFCALVTGVFALTQATYTVKGSMSYSLEYGLLELETTVYKYVGTPITQEQGETYFGNFDELESIPEYDKYYCTYDENYLLKDTVENQVIENMDLTYKEGQAYFVVVHATSQTKDKAIKVTVETSFNIENSWFVTTGSTVLTKNKTGKDIIFAWGIENSALSSNGDFSFNITFAEDTDYVPQDTGFVNVKVADKSTTEEAYVENFTEQFTDFNEAEYYEKTLSVEMSTDQMEQMTEDGGTTYYPIINLSSGKYGINTTVSIELKNVTLYDQDGKVITLESDSVFYMSLYNCNFDSLEDAMTYVQNSGIQIIPQTVPPKVTFRLDAGEEQKACIFICFFSDSTSTTQPSSISFDLEIVVQERVVVSGDKLPYAVKNVVFLSGDSIIAPGRTKNKQQPTLKVDTAKYDLLEIQDKVAYVDMTMAEFTTYMESMGMCEVPAVMENLALYGNPLVLYQIWGAYIIMLIGGIDGYLPIVKTQCTINGTPMNPENWYADMFVIFSTLQTYSSDAEKAAFCEQYLMPLPTTETEKITIPFHLYKIEDANAYMSMIMSIFTFAYSQDTAAPLEFALWTYNAMIQVYIQQGLISASTLGLPDNYSNIDFLKFALSKDLAEMDNADLGDLDESWANYTVDFEYTVFVPGDEVEVINSDYPTQKYGSMYFNYDKVNYNISEYKDLSSLFCKEFATDSSSYQAIDGVLYSSDMQLVKYPNLKEGTAYTTPNGATGILSHAFENVNNLTTVTTTANVQSLGTAVFDGSNIGTLNIYQPIIDNTMANFISSVLSSNISTVNIYATTYVSQSQKDEIFVISNIPASIIYSDSAFGIQYEERTSGAYIVGLTNKSFLGIEIPSSVRIGTETLNVVGIADGVFANCANVEEIILPETITDIGNNNFASCTNLQRVYLGNATLTNFGTGNYHSNLEIYTKNETTLAKIKSGYANAISVDWELMIERYTSTNIGSGPTGSSEDFEYTLTIGQKSYTIQSTYISQIVDGRLDKIMIIFPETAGSLNVSLTASINVMSSGNNIVESIQELISLSRKESDGTYTKITGTPTDETYANHNQVATVTVSYPNNGTPVTVNTGDELRLRIYFTVMEKAKCFTTGTQVTMADGTYKNIEDITYDDLLMVYDFDRGDFGVSYPAWMAKPGKYGCYYLMEFDDGSTLDIVISHRLFTEDDLDYNKSVDADYSSIGKKFVKQIMVDGLPRLTTVTCTNITRIDEEITYYNIVTSQALNFFSNGFIGATGIANMYTFDKIDDQTYVHNQDQLNYTKSGTTDDETGTMFAYERFNTERIPYYVYVAYRLGEIRNMVNVLSKVPPYNQYPLSFVEAYAISLVDDYFKDSYMEDIAEMPDTFKVTLSDREQKVRYEEGDFYTLPTPNNATNFVGWYNTFDGKIYQPGDSAEIYMNTHFIARYSA